MRTLSLARFSAVRPWLLRGAGVALAATAAAAVTWLAPRARVWLPVAAAAAAVSWLAWHAWRWLRALSRAARATAPGGALAAVAERTGDLEKRLAELAGRLDRLERLSDAREQDDRHLHDGDVVEVLGALLDLNEAVRGAAGPSRTSATPVPVGAATSLPPAVRPPAGREPR